MSDNKSDIILEVKNLDVRFFVEEGTLPAVDGLSFSMKKGEALGIVGESGCGKSMAALSIMGLIRKPGKITKGEILFQGKDLTKLSDKEIRKVRGKNIAMIFQEPMTSLNPVVTVGVQIMEAIQAHEDKISKKQAREKAIEMLKLVNIPLPEKRIDEYPHQLSGGMRQRVMIAMALSCSPELLICDEPTTALDVTIQAQILKLISGLKQKFNSSVIMITHDMGVISKMVDKVMVMYAGQAVEYTNKKDLFEKPLHPYTIGLIHSIPQLDQQQQELEVIEGSVPMLSELPEGCLFHPRCKFAKDICRQTKPELINVKESSVRCWRYLEQWSDKEGNK
jgi:peptide/nickel transport system ATP-binding protein/oligopeptide transport system ATP-binding protein